MKPDDKDKLDKCLEILDTTDLGLSLVWLWTWSTVTNILESEDWQAEVTRDQMWDNLCEAVEAGHGFTLEFGAEDHHEGVLEWMLNRGYILDPMDELEEEEEDADDADLHQSTTE
jgi:hypothetical protein